MGILQTTVPCKENCYIHMMHMLVWRNYNSCNHHFVLLEFPWSSYDVLCNTVCIKVQFVPIGRVVWYWSVSCIFSDIISSKTWCCCYTNDNFFQSWTPCMCTANPLQVDTIMYKLSAIRQECKVTILMRGCRKNVILVCSVRVCDCQLLHWTSAPLLSKILDS